MLGVYFQNVNKKQPRDLRRLLSDYGFKGHPLLKLFPVTGNYEKKYYSTLNKICVHRIKELQLVYKGDDVPEINEE